jgi:hypothetical protein
VRGRSRRASAGIFRNLSFCESDSPIRSKPCEFKFWGPRIIATNRQAPRIYPRMIPLCSRFDSMLFTPKMSAIASYGNYSRSPFV